jgi:hypothetical protein
MRNRFTSTFKTFPTLALLAIVLLCGTGMAAPGFVKDGSSPDPMRASTRSFELIPEAGTEVLITHFRAEIAEDGTVTLRGTGTFTFGQPPTAFLYQVDLDRGTYLTQRIDPGQIELSEGDIVGRVVQRSGNLAAPSLKDPGVSSFSTFVGHLIVQTWDPAGAKLTETYNELTWSNSSGYPWQSAGYYCWAANPSKFNTHWFTSSCSPNGPYYRSGSEPVCFDVVGQYYNDDFLLASKRTRAIGFTYLCGGNGYFSYTWDHQANGEAAYLLHGEVVAY